MKPEQKIKELEEALAKALKDWRAERGDHQNTIAQLGRVSRERDEAARQLAALRNRIYTIDRCIPGHDRELVSITINSRVLNAHTTEERERYLAQMVGDSIARILRETSGADYVLRLVREELNRK